MMKCFLDKSFAHLSYKLREDRVVGGDSRRPTWSLAYLRHPRSWHLRETMLTSFRKVRRGVREGARVPPHLRPRLRVGHAAGDDGGGWPGERVRGWPATAGSTSTRAVRAASRRGPSASFGFVDGARCQLEPGTGVLRSRTREILTCYVRERTTAVVVGEKSTKKTSSKAPRRRNRYALLYVMYLSFFHGTLETFGVPEHETRTRSALCISPSGNS